VISQGVTFDTGMLVALERRKQSAWETFRRVRERKARVTIPVAVIGEWWRGRTDLRVAICSAVHVEPMTDTIARLAGEALAKVKRGTTIDAFVMSSAALRGDVVYTGDVEDLERFGVFFPGVRVRSIEGGLGERSEQTRGIAAARAGDHVDAAEFIQGLLDNK
jgi:predicted nucleic acid-binding protein